MKKKTKDFNIDWKSMDDEKGEASGYLSIFGNIDYANDIVVKGAYKDTLAEKSVLPMLFQHDPDRQIGVMIAKEDEKGLFVDVKYFLNTQLGKEKYELAKANKEAGLTTGLSIGYSIKERDYDEIDGQQVRLLKAINLREGSQVTFPCNTLCSLEDVKSVEDISAKDIEHALREVEGISNSIAKKYANIVMKDLREEDNENDVEEITKDETAEVVVKDEVVVEDVNVDIQDEDQKDENSSDIKEMLEFLILKNKTEI